MARIVGDLKVYWTSFGRTGWQQLFLSRTTGERNMQRSAPFIVGEHVRVRRCFRAPLSGQCGRIVDVNPGDARAPYLLQFDNGLRFRYPFEELQRILADPSAQSET